MTRFGAELVKILKGRDMSQAALARKLGVSRERVNQTITGRCPAGYEFAARVAKILKVKHNKLVAYAALDSDEATWNKYR